MGHHRTKKPYLQLLDKPILTHTIGVFDQTSVVDAIYVIVNPSDFETCQSIAIAPYGFQKVAGLIPGGETRQDSVFNGLQALPDDADFVIVHDGVRPFVTGEIISVCLEAADKWGAAVAAVPVKDTVKVADAEEFIVDTLDRSKLWAVQTPQAFRTTLVLEAHQRARQDGIKATDDATLIEQLGFKVKLIRGSYRNLKITTPEDLIIAEALKLPIDN
jgi:2-C-methyl-D-erythritol 4-phosphate cytidylyltransferase